MNGAAEQFNRAYRGRGYWAENSRRVIVEAMSAHDGDALETLRRIDERYPFGERKYHPYKMWLKARMVARQVLGLADVPRPAPKKPRSTPVDPRQQSLFGVDE